MSAGLTSKVLGLCKGRALDEAALAGVPSQLPNFPPYKIRTNISSMDRNAMRTKFQTLVCSLILVCLSVNAFGQSIDEMRKKATQFLEVTVRRSDKDEEKGESR